MTGADRLISLPHTVLDALLPMHVVVGEDGRICHAAPTFRKVCPAAEPERRDFLDIVAVERPLKLAEARSVGELVGARLRMRFLDRPGSTLKGLVTRLGDGAGFLVDFSFGISIVSAVAEHGLTGADFSQSDQTVEMLYLAEANAAAMSEARRLIRRLELSRDAAEAASLTDGLTGLGNRRAIEGWLAARVRTRRPFALLQVDLDHFKAVNDTHGHAAGDAVLQAAARRLRRELRPSDDLARVGGDEFVVLLDGSVTEEVLRQRANRLIEVLEAPIDAGGVQARISASIGGAVSTRYAEPGLEAMLRDADAALYAAKRTGRGRAAIADL